MAAIFRVLRPAWVLIGIAAAVGSTACVGQPDPQPSPGSCSGDGTLTLNNNSGESVSVTLSSSGSQSPQSITLDNGATSTTSQAVGTIQVTATGSLTGNPVLQASPAIACGTTTTLTIAAEPTFSLNVSVIGSGYVAVGGTAAEPLCLTNSTFPCSTPFLQNQKVTLTASAESGFQFSSWSGACTGTTPTCTVTVSQAQTVTAQFSPLQSAVSVVLTGNGKGTVVSNPGNISCGNVTGVSNTTCTTDLADGSSVTLTATPATGSVFSGWDGYCINQSGGKCQVSIAQATQVSAQFTLVPEQLSLTVTGGGTGVVFGGSAAAPYPAYCASASDVLPGNQSQLCSPNFNYGTQVTLTAQPDPGMQFSGWSGACSGFGTTCTVSLVQALSVTADFEPGNEPIHVALGGSGNGTVLLEPSGTTCSAGNPSGCTESPRQGTYVTLAATAGTGSYFSAWTSGPCKGSSNTTCYLNAVSPVTITADFEPDLKVAVNVVGQGSVTWTDPGASSRSTCTPNGACTASANPDYQMSFSPAPTGASVFMTWGGLCTGQDSTINCSLNFNQVQAVHNPSVTAQFVDLLMVSTWGQGQGTITTNVPGGFGTCNLAGGCRLVAPDASTVTLTAMPATSAYGFAGWTAGPCQGSTLPTCSFTATNSLPQIAARFEPITTLSLSVSGLGNPVVQIHQTAFGGTQTTCSGPNTCNLTVWSGANLELQVNSTYSIAWGGACAPPLGSGTYCPLSISQNTSVTVQTYSVSKLYLTASCATGPGTLDIKYYSSNNLQYTELQASVPVFQSVLQPNEILNVAGGTVVELTPQVAPGATATWVLGPCAGQTQATCTFTVPNDGSADNLEVEWK